MHIVIYPAGNNQTNRVCGASYALAISCQFPVDALNPTPRFRSLRIFTTSLCFKRHSLFQFLLTDLKKETQLCYAATSIKETRQPE